MKREPTENDKSLVGKYDDGITLDRDFMIPVEVMEAAHKIHAWAICHGFKNYEIGPIADRSLVAKLRRRIESEQRSLSEDWETIKI